LIACWSFRETVQLLVFKGCPLADAGRESLKNALAELGIRGYEEIDILALATPKDVQGWGSPTILVNCEDVTGGSKDSGVGCRVYSGPDRAPSPLTIIASIRSQRA
jgi:hypothetical protein